VAARSKASVCGRLLAEIWVRIPPGEWMSVSCECCVLPDRDHCVGLITRPEESYRVCGVSECDREASIMTRPWPTRGGIIYWLVCWLFTSLVVSLII
jgi:hypothetical protein